MTALAVWKRTTEFTRPQVEAWHNALCCFPIEVINRAVIQICLTDVRFPEVGDLYQACREEARSHPQWREIFKRLYGQDAPKKISSEEIRSVADRMGLKV